MAVHVCMTGEGSDPSSNEGSSGSEDSGIVREGRGKGKEERPLNRRLTRRCRGGQWERAAVREGGSGRGWPWEDSEVESGGERDGGTSV